MASLLKNRLCRLAQLWLHRPKARQVAQRCGQVELLESRRLLSAWDRTWEFVVVSGTELPGTDPPYEMTINSGVLNSHSRKGNGLSLVEVPGQGNVPFKTLKIKGDTLKGKVKSGDIKGKVELKGDFEDNRTPNDGDLFTGGMEFQIRIPGVPTITISVAGHP